MPNKAAIFGEFSSFKYLCAPPAPRAALLKLLNVAVPCFVETVKKEQERQVVMGVLESMNSVIKACKEHVFKNPRHLQKVSHAIRDVLKKKVRAGRDARAVEKWRSHSRWNLGPFFSFLFFFCFRADGLPG